MKQITFIFKNGRSKRLENDPEGPKEFFYTFNLFKMNHEGTAYVEGSQHKKSYIFKILRKITKLPFFVENFYDFVKIKKIYKSEIIVSTNQNLSFSILPIILFKKLLGEIKLFTFAMGFTDLENSKRINKFFIKLFLMSSEKIIFISLNEYNKALNQFKQFSDKFIYIPFSIDSKFWVSNTEKKLSKNLLFIGNDSNRDFDFIIKLAKFMPDYDFKIITEKILDNKYENVDLISGNWNKQILSDSEIKQIYIESFLTLIPLKNSFQPSGQSVALQSMSVGTPVLITKTNGFWDNTLFNPNEHIFFCEENDIEIWKSKINTIYDSPDDYINAIENGRSLVVNHLSLEKMYQNLKGLIL